MEKFLNMNVHVLGKAQCVCPEIAHAQFKGGWGWVLEAGVASTEPPYIRCVKVVIRCA